MRAVARQILAELGRRRLQSTILIAVVVLASGTATLALTLIAESSDPYDAAFAHLKGAHLLASFDSSKVSPEQAAVTGERIGASVSVGPWPATDVGLEHAGTKYSLTAAGRKDPDGAVDVLHLTAGRWVERPGEVVITRSLALSNGLAIGDELTVISTPGEPRLRIVGEAIDVDQAPAGSWAQSAWVVPGQVPELVAPGSSLDYQMAYRFPGAPTAAELESRAARLKSTLPAASVTSVYSYLDVQSAFNSTISILLVLLIAFGLFALAAVILIVANVVTGAVIARYRDIGVLKAVGFMPHEVVVILVGTMVAPAVVGIVVGIGGGTVASRPLLAQSGDALALPAQATFSPLIALVCFWGVLLPVAAAAALPAWRAGRLNPVTAMTIGAAPATSYGTWLSRALSGLGAPRVLSLGAGDAMVRPLRGILTAVAILIGVATLTFAYGLQGSFNAYRQFAPLQGQVIVERTPVYPDARVMSTLKAQPETGHVVMAAFKPVSVPGLSEPVSGTFYGGDSMRLGWLVSQGRWFAAPGEAVAGKAFLQEAGLRVGDRFTGTIGGRAVPIRIVGVTFNPSNRGRVLMSDWSTLAMAAPDVQPLTYYVELRPGSDPAAYAARVQRTEHDLLDARVSDFGAQSFAIFEAVMLGLGVVLSLIAVVGVFNTVLLNTREKTRDTAILKVLGMTPGQVATMTAVSAAVLGIAGGLPGVAAGIAIHRGLMVLVGNVIGNDLPPVAFDVFNPLALPLLGVAGVAVAVMGAVLPARWAAQTAPAAALHTE